jgi:LAO/AO transport system kinase
VDDIVDVFVLLVSPEGGDELQAMKRGVMEAADIVVVTKADGDLAARARNAAADYGNALRLLRRKQPEWDRQVLVCSAVSGEGVIGVWDTIVRHHEVLARPGVLDRRRAEQARSWLWREITESLLREFRDDPGVARLAAHIEDQVAAGLLSAGSGAVQLLAAHRGA